MGSCDFEAVSALVDGELSESECDTVIQHLNECRDCCRLFERFHTTRTLVRGEGEPVVPEGFCERVSAAIAKEEPLSRPGDQGGSNRGSTSRSSLHSRYQWGWLATAAGVAGVAVAGAMLWSQTANGPVPGSGASSTLAQSPHSGQETSESRVMETSTTEDKSMATIRRYLPEHSNLVPSDPKAEFQRTRLEVNKR